MKHFIAGCVALLAAALSWSPALAQSSAGGGVGGGSGGGGPATQSGAWNVGLTGTLPAFAATPTFNVGTIAGIATDASVQAVKTALGSPLQAGGAVSVSNLPTTQAISAANLPLPNGAATASNQATQAQNYDLQVASNRIEAVRALLAGTISVATPTPAAVTAGQVKIATTGTAVQLPSRALVNGIVIKAKATNAAQSAASPGVVGTSGLGAVADGTGAGYSLAPGESVTLACANASAVYVNGTAGDVFYFAGN